MRALSANLHHNVVDKRVCVCACLCVELFNVVWRVSGIRVEDGFKGNARQIRRCLGPIQTHLAMILGP